MNNISKNINDRHNADEVIAAIAEAMYSQGKADGLDEVLNGTEHSWREKYLNIVGKLFTKK